ncbi:TonB-dependent receptor domain-containing protein [Lacibacterium aquatile]|uniref:TonB-dependent receptor domain-containing protein n=1 Tax=Lacibacterium aquatile TaxID=1168082 RepID=A0ABW5DQV0_9PROT
MIRGTVEKMVGLRLAALAVSTALGSTMILAATATTAVAQQAAQVPFSIPAQSLPDALALFGRQANLQVSAPGDLVRGASSTAVSGTMAPDAALRQLLGGTGLTFRIGSNGTAIIERAQQSSATTLAPLTLEGRRVEDKHAGAADRENSIVVDSETLARRNAPTLKQVFAGQTGVSVGGAQQMSQKVYVQGVEETNLAVSIDGARQNNKVFHHSGTNLMDPSLLKMARVDPGVAPADAGPGALGGAIVYETVDAADLLAPGRSLGGFLTSSYETNGDTFTKGASVYGRAEGFEAIGFANFADGNSYRDGSGQKALGTAANLDSYLLKGAYESEGGHRLELSGEKVVDKAFRRFRANIGSLLPPTAPLRLYDMERQNYAFNYNLTKPVGIWDPKITLGYGKTELGVPQPWGSVGDTSSLSGKIENSFHFRTADTVTVGADFYDDEARYREPGTEISEKARNYGLYAQARLVPVEDLRLSFGLRGDTHKFEGVDGSEITHSGLSGNISGAYDIFKIVTLKAGYSNVFGGIALAENFIMNPGWSYVAGIDPVRSNNYTLGFEVNHQGFSFGAGVFRSDFKNARNEAFGGGPSITSNFKTEGYSLSAGYNWGSGLARISYTDTDFKVGNTSGDSDFGQYLATPVGQLIALEAFHRFDSIGLTIGGSVDAALQNNDPKDQGLLPLKGYTAVGLYTEYQPTMAQYLTVRLEANNLFDETYADRATYGQEFSNVRPLYEPGRSFLIKAKLTY